MQQADQFGMDLCQFGKFIGGQLMQGFCMAFQNNDQSVDHFDRIGMFDQPMLPLKDRRAWGNALFSGVGFAGPAFHGFLSLMRSNYDREHMGSCYS